MSSDDPYSRLKALERMGVVENYEKIRNCRLAIVGVGGVGSVAAEMLCRLGIGRLYLFDYDKVEPANLNRLFYRPEQCGISKVNAAFSTLKNINPDVEIEAFNLSITLIKSYPILLKVFEEADLILSCVDNYEARVAINKVCNELEKPWFESGVSENAISGHIQFMLPGRTACFLCAPPFLFDSGIPESSLKREGVCTASLPTTMGLISAMLVQNAIKYLLDFGKVSYFLGYNALDDFFPQYPILPNPLCSDSNCIKLQSKYPHWKPTVSLSKTQKPESVTHKDSEWKITLEASGDSSTLPIQLTSKEKDTPTPEASDDKNKLEQKSISELALQFKRLQAEQ